MNAIEDLDLRTPIKASKARAAMENYVQHLHNQYDETMDEWERRKVLGKGKLLNDASLLLDKINWCEAYLASISNLDDNTQLKANPRTAIFITDWADGGLSLSKKGE